MSRIRKRLERLFRNPKDIRWDEVVTIVRYYGCTVEEPKGGSHWIIYHQTLPNYQLTVPVHNNRVKPVYIKRIAEFLEELIEEE